MQGLLGSDSGQATDFQLPNGSVLPQPLSGDELLGRFADAWRVAPGASLLDDTSGPAAPVMAPTPAATQFSSAAAFGQAIAGELVPTNAAAYDPGVPLQGTPAPSAGDFLAASPLHPS